MTGVAMAATAAKSTPKPKTHATMKAGHPSHIGVKPKATAKPKAKATTKPKVKAMTKPKPKASHKP